MFRPIAEIVAPLTAAAFLAGPATAQSVPCAERERVLAYVIDERGEVRLATGIAAQCARIDLFAAESGSWSLVLHLPDGRACLLANGQGFQALSGLQPARGLPA